jgi:hypothetical protein
MDRMARMRRLGNARLGDGSWHIRLTSHAAHGAACNLAAVLHGSMCGMQCLGLCLGQGCTLDTAPAQQPSHK